MAKTMSYEQLLEMELKISRLEAELKSCRAALNSKGWLIGDETATEVLREYLQQWKGRWPTLAAETGVSVKWIRRFYAGHIPNPGVKAFEAVMRHRQARTF